MTALPLAHRFSDIDYFGGCPRCGGNDGHLNLGREHWFYCERHRSKWFFGSNLFSAWRDEDAVTRHRSAALLARFVEVEPIWPATRPAGAEVNDGN